MTAGELALTLAVVLLVLGFAGLMWALGRVNDSVRHLRSELEAWRDDVKPLIERLRQSTDDARLVVDEARQDLGRFDRVLGSAEAISGAVEGSSRATRAVLSVPVIKIASLASGTSRAARRWRQSDEPRRRTRR